MTPGPRPRPRPEAEIATAPAPAVRVRHPMPGLTEARLTAPELGPGTVRALLDALDRAERDRNRRVFAVTGDGPRFSTGMPLSVPLTPDATLAALREAHTLFDRLTRSPLVTVAAVDGPAIGGGVALAAACDLLLAGPAATFRLTELLLGLLPALLLPIVARRTGAHRAHVLALTARELTPDQALAVGLADHASPDTAHALRALVLRVGHTDPAAGRALKDYRHTLWPPPDTLDAALAAMRERLEDPTSARHRQRLRDRGLLP
ncbi:enoyl-CoA hydratase-related protein (plasmid) [Streptomyces sp. BI20]|uniref:enoyl-CoA hydratase-related protein n=1 Tax=Streptomyces sp. BI20 TaxID=3403460 RepID=UPI003C761A4F